MKNKKKWKVPVWMKSYSHLVPDFSRAEEFMNCDGVNCNIVTNAPRALMCAMLQARIELLSRLYENSSLYSMRAP